MQKCARIHRVAKANVSGHSHVSSMQCFSVAITCIPRYRNAVDAMENALLRTASYFKRTGLVAVLYLLFTGTPKSLTASSCMDLAFVARRIRLKYRDRSRSGPHPRSWSQAASPIRPLWRESVDEQKGRVLGIVIGYKLKLKVRN